MFCLSIIWLAGLVCSVSSQVYVDYGYPYQRGEFNVSSTIFSPTIPSLNPPPMHTKAYFPDTAGTYAVNYFITGFAGILPPTMYDSFCEQVASHGYVVFSNWVLVGDDGPVIDPETHLLQIQWLSENTAGEMGEAIGSFDNLGFSCHSAGCGTTLQIMNNDTSIAKATVNIEPVSGVITITDVLHQVPTINFGAELANLSCSYPGIDFEAFHRKSNCPKIMFEAKEAGHCDFLDEVAWETCDILNFCVTTDVSIVEPYTNFVQGFTAAFMTAYSQGNLDQLEYVINPSEMPWELLQHVVVETC